MPRWSVGELDPAPAFGWRHLGGMLGPGVIMAGAAIGGGEWLAGPAVTARYGAAIMWVATLSILAQVVYNCEVSRYTLYTGEPIMIGKFRTHPGPIFWLVIYLMLDWGAIFPYLAASAATPVLAMWLGVIPNDKLPEHQSMLQYMSYGILLLAVLPLLFGGKIYNALKAIMLFKIIVVFGFLSLLAIFYTSSGTWWEIIAGLFNFGAVPIAGKVGAEPAFGNLLTWPFTGNGAPTVDRDSIRLLATFAAIAGVGGLSQMSVSNYTRDMGWGMGRHVGAIPSLIGGHNIPLSHSGTVFDPTPSAMERWRGWYNHVLRDQLIVWAPACIIGLALPSILSLAFLPRGIVPSDWTVAGMTAGGVRDAVGGGLGKFFWYMVLFCGFLVLVPSTSSNADGFVRRWVDVSWTAVRSLREWDPFAVKKLYFLFLSIYFVGGLFLLSVSKPMGLLLIAGQCNNFALGFSCFHALYVNTTLLPEPLRPCMFVRISLFFSGVYFLGLAIVMAMVTFNFL